MFCVDMAPWQRAVEVRVTCMRTGRGRPFPSQGVVRSLLATGTVLESAAGMFFSNSVRFRVWTMENVVDYLI